MSTPGKLPPRERQVVEILATKSKGGATAHEIRDGMDAPPSYSAVRALLKVMEEKGLIFHRQDGPRYLYELTTPRKKLRRTALREVLSGFFGGSRAALVETLFDPAEGRLSPTELEQLSQLIKEAKKKGGNA